MVPKKTPLVVLLSAALIHEQEQAREEGEALDTEANKHMPCLLAACASGVPKVVTTALDAIVKVRRRHRLVFGTQIHSGC